ncbi:hypothetical protein AVEN_12127-1 [Araneus ventricosus]|uniref:Uncharacterized protein n=1 Tax=Araneus ventricosus TaxID=182803 RepID=A0A4Y2VSJ9_ARAVE|nr:hypothetical protein AVEN_12127-1 [Araneus ventricosus]
MRHVIHGGSKVRYRRSSIPNFSFPTRRISDFPASLRGPNLGRSFDVPLSSHRGLKLESAHQVLDFEIVEIPALPFGYEYFHRFLKLTKNYARKISTSLSRIRSILRESIVIVTKIRTPDFDGSPRFRPPRVRKTQFWNYVCL